MNTERTSFDDQMAHNIATTQAVVTATHDEETALWLKWAKDSIMHWDNPTLRYEWKSESLGMWRTIATVKIGDETMPICVSLSWAIVDGKRVCFVDATSQVVDWRIVNTWISETFPKAKTSDAANFHNALR